jgi:predicted metal-dependent hydrolase
MAINLTIIRSRRKTFALIINSDGTLTVRAPLRATRAQIDTLIQQKAGWIRAKQTQMMAAGERIRPKQYREGERFLFLGKAYPLFLVDDSRPALRLDDRFYLSRLRLPDAPAVFEAWYRAQARRVITERVHHYADRNGFAFKRVGITGAKTRWGSCGPAGTLNFSWRLVLAPLDVIDYVVVHELAHLEIKNHSRLFWEKVEALMPDYKERRKWLKDNGHTLSIY